jgi:hypothetical protein
MYQRRYCEDCNFLTPYKFCKFCSKYLMDDEDFLRSKKVKNNLSDLNHYNFNVFFCDRQQILKRKSLRIISKPIDYNYNRKYIKRKTQKKILLQKNCEFCDLERNYCPPCDFSVKYCSCKKNITKYITKQDAFISDNNTIFKDQILTYSDNEIIMDDSESEKSLSNNKYIGRWDSTKCIYV